MGTVTQKTISNFVSVGISSKNKISKFVYYRKWINKYCSDHCLCCLRFLKLYISQKWTRPLQKKTLIYKLHRKNVLCFQHRLDNFILKLRMQLWRIWAPRPETLGTTPPDLGHNVPNLRLRAQGDHLAAYGYPRQNLSGATLCSQVPETKSFRSNILLTGTRDKIFPEWDKF